MALNSCPRLQVNSKIFTDFSEIPPGRVLTTWRECLPVYCKTRYISVKSSRLILHSHQVQTFYQFQTHSLQSRKFIDHNTQVRIYSLLRSVITSRSNASCSRTNIMGSDHNPSSASISSLNGTRASSREAHGEVS